MQENSIVRSEREIPPAAEIFIRDSRPIDAGWARDRYFLLGVDYRTGPEWFRHGRMRIERLPGNPGDVFGTVDGHHIFDPLVGLIQAQEGGRSIERKSVGLELVTQ